MIFSFILLHILYVLFFHHHHHTQGSVVALVMDNRPEFFITWMAVAKTGGCTALINHNLKDKPLSHSIQISGCQMLIYHVNFASAIEGDVLNGLTAANKSLIVHTCGLKNTADNSLEKAYAGQSKNRLPHSQRAGCTMNDTVLLVYTSGTTGLPKAATLKHARLFSMGSVFQRFFSLDNERIYNCLPLYHSSGGCVGITLTFLTGSTMVLRSKFSASQFWLDCKQYKATAVQYIGELCRYLMQSPAAACDTQHCVRIAFGNGLRPDIWKAFQTRFNLKEIGEFYGSTEGNTALFNHCTSDESIGAVARSGPLYTFATGYQLVKFDVEAEEPIRDKNGFCVPCQVPFCLFVMCRVECVAESNE
jgi:acyl-CoA synthetase (AMP-forming)/AMP-acid ligase II